MSLLKGKQLTSPVYLTGSLFGSASYALTASYALNGGGGGGGTPGGSNSQIQYNNNNSFSGVPVLIYTGSILQGTGSFSGSFFGLIDSASYAVSGGNQNLQSVLNNGNTTTSSIYLYWKSDDRPNDHSIHIEPGQYPLIDLMASQSSGIGGSTPIVGMATDSQGGYLYIVGGSNGSTVYIRANATNLRTIYMPDKSGTIALIEDLSAFATTGSNTFNGNQTINGNISIYGTASIDYLNVVYETASIIYSSGSNQFGDAANDTQTLYGRIFIPTGSLFVSGSTVITGSLNVTNSITGSLFGTASYSTFAATASYVLNAVSSSYATTASYVKNAVTASYVTTLTQAVTISGSLIVSGSTNLQTSTGTAFSINADTLVITGSLIISGSSVTTGSLSVLGNITATSLTGSLFGTASYAVQALSSSYSLTASYIDGGFY